MVKTAVVADIVGSLADLSVDDGILVRRGDIIGSLESMKTFFPLYASDDGRVQFVVGLGEIVGEGDVVAWIVRD